MKYALVNASNVVENLIIYREGSQYTPPAGLTLRQVNDWVKINDDADINEPLPPEEEAP